MDRYRFVAAVQDPSIYEYPVDTTIEAESLQLAINVLESDYGLTLEEIWRRSVAFVTRDGALVEYDIS